MEVKTAALIGLCCACLLTAGCTSLSRYQTPPPEEAYGDRITKVVTTQYHATDPLDVVIYHKAPPRPVTVIGQVDVDRYDMSGVKRQLARAHDYMRSLAASIGGEAIVAVRHSKLTMSGDVVRFTKAKQANS